MLLIIWLLMLGFFAGWRGRAIFENVLDMIEDRRERRRIGDKPEEESIDTWLSRVEDGHTLAAFREAGLYLGSEPWPGEEGPGAAADRPDTLDVAEVAALGVATLTRAPAWHRLQLAQAARLAQGQFGHPRGLGALQQQQSPQLGALQQQSPQLGLAGLRMFGMVP